MKVENENDPNLHLELDDEVNSKKDSFSKSKEEEMAALVTECDQ
jgi:hypothetical protein